MDRLRAHVVATAVLTAALAALPVAMQKPTSAASTSRAGRPSAATRPSPRTASASAQPSIAISSTQQPLDAAATPSATSTPDSTPTPTPTVAAPPTQEAQAPTAPATAATVPFPCPDARQVGATAYTRWHGMIAFSVKQFYSPACHTVYGYAYPWLQFRALKARYALGLGVYDLTHDAIVGARTLAGGLNGSNLWSAPFGPQSGSCTEGLAHVFFPDLETDTFTEKFCA